jgi:hypothetical protein
MDEIQITPYVVLAYFIVVSVIAIISFFALSVLSKHAEKPSIARAISVTYTIVFIVVTLASLSAFIVE